MYTQVLAFDREVGDADNDGADHHRLGDLHLRLDRLAEARAEYELALAIARERGNASAEGVALSSVIAGVQARTPWRATGGARHLRAGHRGIPARG